MIIFEDNDKSETKWITAEKTGLLCGKAYIAVVFETFLDAQVFQTISEILCAKSLFHV